MDTQEMILVAGEEVRRLRSQGWQQTDFAYALRELIQPDPIIVESDFVTCGHCQALNRIMHLYCANCGRIN